MGQNPNLPVVNVKTWPVDPPASGAMPTSASVDLAGKTKVLSTQRGRQYELDKDQAGTATLTVDNSDGSLTGGANGHLPLRPVQVTATWAGTTYPLFTGYVERWPTQSVHPSRAWSTLTLIDLFAALTQRTVRSGMTESVLALKPAYYWPLTEPRGSVAAGNLATPIPGTVNASMALHANTVAIDSSGLTPGGFGVKQALPADGTTGLYGSLGHSPQGLEGVVVGVNAASQPQWDPTQPWAWAFTFTFDGSSNPNGTTTLFTTVDNFVGLNISFIISSSSASQQGIGGGGSYVSGQILSSATSGPSVNLTSSPITAGPIAVAFGYDGTNYWMECSSGPCYVYPGGQPQPPGTTSSTPALFTLPLQAQVMVGTTYFTNGTYAGNQLFGTYGAVQPSADVVIGHVALWCSSGGTSPTSSYLANYLSAIAGFPGETSDQRVGRILGWLGVTNTSLEAGTIPLAGQAVTSTQAMLDVLRQVAADDLSRLFIAASGQVTLLSRNHGQQTLTAPPALGGNTGAGEVPYTGAPVLDFDPTRIYNDVQVQQNGGPTMRATDATSQGSYFQRVLQITVNTQNAADALYAAEWLLNRYSQPVVRVQTVTLDLASNSSWFPTVLALELGQRIVLNHRTITGGTTSALTVVDQIGHDIDAEKGTWTCTLQLSPAFGQYGLLGGMRTTLSSSCAAAATTIHLAPMADAAYSAAEWVLHTGTVLVLDGANAAKRETVTVTSVASSPTPGATGYTSVTVGCTATSFAHSSGATVWEQPLNIEGSPWNDPADWAGRGDLDSTLVLAW